MSIRKMMEETGYYTPPKNCKFYRNYCIYKDIESGMSRKEVAEHYGITVTRVRWIYEDVKRQLKTEFYSRAYATIEDDRQLTFSDFGFSI